MPDLVFPGLRTKPLAGYLAALGVWRAAVRLLDPNALGRFTDRPTTIDGLPVTADTFILTTTAADTVEEIADLLLRRYEPLAIASPWNADSGFLGNGKKANAEKTLRHIREATDPRLRDLRETVMAADATVTEARRRGWGSGKDGAWDPKRKKDLLELARGSFPDEALFWLDATTALGPEGDPTYNRILGTGGNFGRQELSFTHAQRVLRVLDPASEKKSQAWLRAALTGDESVPYERESAGQFDPGRAGGIQSSTSENDIEGFVNPWTFLFTLEGALLFTSSVVRRQGGRTAKMAIPFSVRSTPIGYVGGAESESVLGELWSPVWTVPASLADITRLLSEGRAEWRGETARSGLDFIRAVVTLGVARGIDSFTRYLFVERHGQNPLAVPAGRVKVRHRPEVVLLAELDGWLRHLRSEVPATVTARVRAVERAQYAAATSHDLAAALRVVLIAVGRLHETVSRSGAARKAVGRPLRLTRAAAWLAAIGTDEPELRLAISAASGRDDASGALRGLFIPETPNRQWSERPTTIPTSADIIDAMITAHQRRAMPGAVAEPRLPVVPAVRGVYSAFHHGVPAPAADVAAFATGTINDELFGDYLRALMLIDIPANAVSPDPTDNIPTPPDLALLSAFYAPVPLRLSGPRVLRPGPTWLNLLAADRVDEVIQDAISRARIEGITCARVRPTTDGRRLAAALLLPMTPGDRIKALSAVADLNTLNPRDHEGAPA